MKTFENLTINDCVYIVKIKSTLLPEKDYYGNLDNPNTFTKEKLKDLTLTDRGRLRINSNYNGEWLLVGKDDLNKTSFIKDDKVYISDEAVYIDEMRKECLRQIEIRENKIKSETKRLNEEIAAIRSNYWATLNPSTI